MRNELTMIKSLKILSSIILIGGIVTTADSAYAAGLTTETCVSQSYACQSWGYTGTDNYGYFHFSSLGSNGTLHNCTAYVGYMLDFVTPYDSRWGTLGDASTWATRARGFGLQVGSVPHVGDIAQWNFGHVAFVEKVNRNSSGNVVSLIVTDDNYGRMVTTSKTIYVGSTGGAIAFPDNFITFPAYSGGGGRGPNPLSQTLPTN
jgi:surface antigen